MFWFSVCCSVCFFHWLVFPLCFLAGLSSIRQNVLDEIKAKLEESPVLALVGLHGMGKSQAALAYALKAQEEGKHGFVRWLDADARLLDASLRELAVRQ